MRERLAALRHLIAKDLRYVGSWAASCWILAAAGWLWVYADRQLDAVAQVHFGLAQFVPLFVLARLFQGDFLLGSTSFWATRPIDRVDLLVSKLVVGLGAVILPCALVLTLPVGFRGLELASRDHLVVFATLVVRYLLVAWLMVLAAALTRGLLQALALAAGVFLALVAVIGVYERAWPVPRLPARTTLGLLMPLFMTAGTVMVLYVLYKTRRVAAAGAALALLGLASIGLHRTWRWELMKPLLAAEAWERPTGQRTDWGPLTVRVEPGALTWETVGGRTLAKAVVRVENLPAGLSLVETQYTVRAAGRGETERHFFIDSEPDGRWRGTSPYWVPDQWQAALGCPAGAGAAHAGEGMRGQVEVFRRDLAGPGPGPARGMSQRIDGLRGRLRFAVVRPFVLQRDAVREGGRLAFRRARITAERVPPSEAAAGLVVRTETLFVPPFHLPSNTIGTLAFLDRTSGECLFPTGRTDSVPTAGLPVRILEHRVEDWRGPARAEGAESRAVAVESLEMVVLSGEVLGTLEVAFETPAPSLEEGKRP